MTSRAGEGDRGTILVVDDTPANLRLLSNLLTEKGYNVRAVINGRMALMTIRAFPPELVLLDICMPEMDGYEVCRQIKADPVTQDIPVIFISALDEVMDKVKAFGAGGVDYITKPFQVAEVLARVETHLTLRRLRQQLQQQNDQLKQEVRDRQVAEEKYRSILENAVEGFFQVSTTGEYITINRSLAEIYGYDSIEDMMTSVKNIDHLYVRQGRRGELNAYLKRYGQVTDFESQVYCKDGSKTWISENVRAVLDEQQQPLYYEGMVQDISERRQTEAELYRQRQETERLLLSILPQSIAERLKRREMIADSFPSVSVLFADIVDFTRLSARIPPAKLLELLKAIFSEFDRLAELYNLEKIKTIGDEYMVAGGLPLPHAKHIQAIADMALTMQESIKQFRSDEGDPFRLRIGINTGPVIAGVIGTKKFAYDLWGETVNLASRMQSQGLPGLIQVTPAVYEKLVGDYVLEERGIISVKGVGDVTTYWLKGRRDFV